MKFSKVMSKYFELSGTTNSTAFYDLIAGYQCTCNDKYDVVVLSVSRSDNTITHIHDTERGELELSPGAVLSIFKVTTKKVADFS